MVTIKSYTDIEQSKKLAKILPLESADMFYNEEPEDETYPKDIVDTKYPMVIREGQKHYLEEYGIPCWSVAALLSVLPNGTDIVKDEADTENEHYMCTVGIKDDIIPTFGKNPIDACVDMIEKLHELNLL